MLYYLNIICSFCIFIGTGLAVANPVTAKTLSATVNTFNITKVWWMKSVVSKDFETSMRLYVVSDTDPSADFESLPLFLSFTHLKSSGEVKSEVTFDLGLKVEKIEKFSRGNSDESKIKVADLICVHEDCHIKFHRSRKFTIRAERSPDGKFTGFATMTLDSCSVMDASGWKKCDPTIEGLE